MIIAINGKNKEIPEKSTTGDLLKKYRDQKSAVVIEVNRQIVTDDKCEIFPGDKIEIVTFVGGG
jgi:thiamine biosynthesis protein ThiS